MSGPRVVAIGDSITYGVGDSIIAGRSGAGWASHVATALGAVDFINLAANGTRARDMCAAQVPQALMAMPDVVLATVGGNDVLRGDFDPDQIAVDVHDALMCLTRPGRHVMLVSLDHIQLFALMPRAVSDVMADRIDRTNTALSHAVAGTGATLLDGARALASHGTRAWHIDRVHPSPVGHRALALAAVAHLDEHFARQAAISEPGPAPRWSHQAWWLLRNGAPWVAKRSRDLIPQVAQLVTHELLEQRRHRVQA